MTITRLIAEGPPKRCTHCRKVKPRSEFYARSRGNRTDVQGRCIPCYNAQVRVWKLANPDRVAAYTRKYREKLRLDGERDRAIREREKARKALRREARARANAVPMLPAAPFIAWLKTLGENVAQIVDASGLSAHRVRQYLRGDVQTVELDVVDRACIHADADLNSLYPMEEAA